ncbi:MAG TPA: YraN family protein [Chitinophagaceae bacterium]|nr:YraN family protein [Chitinophagaceae bacterium]
MANHNQLGKEGEALALAWLTQRGFAILHQNWRHSHYELDIVATHNNILHFVEVKTRRGTRFGEPEEAVNRSKIRRLLKAGAAYQYEYPQWKRVQYDVLSITLVEGHAAEYFFIEDVYL